MALCADFLHHRGVRRSKTDEAAFQKGWQNACQLYQHLSGGGELAVLPPTLRLDPGEAAFADMGVGVASFFAYDRAETTQMLGPFLHTKNLSREIHDLMTPRWRGHSTLRCVLTDQRLLVHNESWQSLWHQYLMELKGHASEWTYVLEYEESIPLMLFGPPSSFLVIMLAWVTYGQEGLALPAFAPIAAAVADNIRRPDPQAGPGLPG